MGAPTVYKKVQIWIFKPSQPRQFLILKLNAQRGGFWQPVTGGVEEGEDFEDAARREVQEETGLELVVKSLDEAFFFEKAGKKFEEQVYFAEAPLAAQVRLDPHEHIDCQWVLAERAREKIFYDSNKQMLERVMKRIKF
jgi:8-oxo-dGTP pyrophosphatase MutT (NUDIX family)